MKLQLLFLSLRICLSRCYSNSVINSTNVKTIYTSSPVVNLLLILKQHKRVFFHISIISTRSFHVKQELPTHPEYLSSPRFKWGSHRSMFSFLCSVLYIFILTTVLSFLLPFWYQTFLFMYFPYWFTGYWYLPPLLGALPLKFNFKSSLKVYEC
jgi:hypothetical protein